MRQDLVAAYRALTASKTFTAVAVTVLALGIGATAAIYSVVDHALFRELRFADADRLIVVREHRPSAPPDSTTPIAPQNFLDWDAQQDVFDPLAAYATSRVTIVEPGQEPEDLAVRRTTADSFAVLGLRPALGRFYGAEHEVEGRNRLVVLSHGLWQRRYGANPAIVGQTIPLDGVPHEILGVLPPWATTSGGPAGNVEAFVPLAFPSSERIRVPNSGPRYLTSVGRLKPGMSLARAQDRMDQIAAGLRAAHPVWNEEHFVRLVPLQDQMLSGWRSWLWMLLASAGMVLLIAAATVALLQLSRAAAREHEMSVRMSLGGSRWRLIRQLLVDNVALVVSGTLAALAVAHGAVGLLKAAMPGAMPRLDEVSVDLRVLGAMMAVAVVAGIGVGVAPALHLSAPRLALGLKDAMQSVSGKASQRARRAFVVAEVALAVVLLVGAALFVRSFRAATTVDLGFDHTGVWTVTVTAPQRRPARPEEQRVVAATVAPDTRFLEELVERVSELPGVTDVAYALPGLPLGGSGSSSSFEIRGRVLPGDPWAMVRRVTPGYHRTLRIPLLEGRLLSADDRPSDTPPMLINRAVVRAFFDGTSPLGQTVVIGEVAHVVVGVIGDVRHSAEEPPQPEVNVPLWAGGRGLRGVSGHLAVRATADSQVLWPLVRRIAIEVLPDLPVRSAPTLEARFAMATAWRRFDMWLVSLFSLLGVLIGAIGLYGVLAYGVGQRTREIGVRMALGATPGGVVRLVASEAAALVATGVGMGAVASWWLVDSIRGYLFEVEPRDVTSFTVAIGLMIAASLLACVVPARGAVRVDPSDALRAQ
jgi:predicted permease